MEIISKFKDILGGRQAVIVLDGAITSSQFHNFLKLCFDNAMIWDIYGTSEVRGCEWINWNEVNKLPLLVTI